MPKRTDDFQQLVRYIYEKTAGTGASVEESAEHAEPNGGCQREIDVLVTYRECDTLTRIAVECRDRADIEDIQWIDEVIGKYADLSAALGIVKIVAVSSAGFSQMAVLKAAAHGIELISLEDALEVEWESEFDRLMIADVQLTYSLTSVGVEFDKPMTGRLSSNPGVIDSTGNCIGDMAGLANHLFKTIVEPEVVRFLRIEYQERNKTMADVKSSGVHHSQVAIEGLALRDEDGVDWSITRMDMDVSIKPTVRDLDVMRSRIGPALVTSGVMEVGGKSVRINTTQVQGLKEGFYTVEVKKSGRPLGVKKPQHGRKKQ